MLSFSVMDWFVTIDLKDAYFPISIHQISCNTFNEWWQKSIVQGGVIWPINNAHWLFLQNTSLCSMQNSHLRRQGIFVYPYLDEWLLKATECEDHDQYIFGSGSSYQYRKIKPISDSEISVHRFHIGLSAREKPFYWRTGVWGWGSEFLMLGSVQLEG